MDVANRSAVVPFTTKDGSEIRELCHPRWTAAVNQSLAEATIPAGGATAAHHHPRTEELYLVTEGRGLMRVGSQEREVGVGDCVVIPPGVEHQLTNLEAGPLRVLCCCAPAYSDDDTVLAGSESPPGTAA